MTHNNNIIDLSKHRKTAPEPTVEPCDCDACKRTKEILAACCGVALALELRSEGFTHEQYVEAQHAILHVYVKRMREEVTWPIVDELQETALEAEAAMRRLATELDEIKRIVIPVAISKVEAYRQEILRLGGDPATVRIRRRKPGGKSKSRRSGSEGTE